MPADLRITRRAYIILAEMALVKEYAAGFEKRHLSF
jgi:hypothetical protein